MIHKIFERAAKVNAEKTAVMDSGSGSLSYKALSDYTNQLANYLRKKAIKKGDYVVCHLPRGVDQVAIFLALSKLGAIYVPVSLQQNAQRFKQVLENCQPKSIIAQHKTETMSSALQDNAVGVTLINRETIIAESDASYTSTETGHEDDVLYVSYSSGSTGKPKGIPIRHTGINRYWQPVLQEQIKHPVLNVLANISTDFDAHIWEYLIAWVFGATLHIANEDMVKDVNLLADFMIERKISDATITPPVLRLFTPKQLSSMKTQGLESFHSTGEACTPDIIKRCSDAGIRVYNCYGPTEATFGASMTLCTLDDFLDGIAPIGFPPKDSSVRLIVLNEDNKPVHGEEGELVIISPYMTPGYLHRPEENQRFFMFETDQGPQRAYRTGDRFIHHNQFLYYKGRFSALSHLKIRGQFVDIMGTENSLRTHNHIKDVAVVSSDDDQTLHAFLVPTDATLSEDNQFIASMHDYLSKKGLIDAAIPSTFHILAQLPLTINGKIDRQALVKRLPSLNSVACTNADHVPETYLEIKIAKIWACLLLSDEQKFLELDKHLGFSLLGGNSIKAMQLASLLKDTFAIEIHVSQMGSLNALTIALLADIIFCKLTLKHANLCLTKVGDSKGSSQPLFLIPPVTGEGVLTYRPLYEKLKVNDSIYVINAPSLSKPETITMNISTLAKAYIQLARSVQPGGPLMLLGWSSGGTIAFEMAQQLEEHTDLSNHLIIIDEISPWLLAQHNNASYAQEITNVFLHLANKLTPQKIEINLEPSLEKTEQIDTLFSTEHMEQFPLETRPMMIHAKNFLKAELSYDPQKTLSKTHLSIFHTLATKDRAHSLLQGSATDFDHLGWSKYTSEIMISSARINGDHFSMIETPPKEFYNALSMLINSCSPMASFSNPEKINSDEINTKIDSLSNQFQLVSNILSNLTYSPPISTPQKENRVSLLNLDRTQSIQLSLQVRIEVILIAVFFCLVFTLAEIKPLFFGPLGIVLAIIPYFMNLMQSVDEHANNTLTLLKTNDMDTQAQHSSTLIMSQNPLPKPIVPGLVFQQTGNTTSSTKTS